MVAQERTAWDALLHWYDNVDGATRAEEGMVNPTPGAIKRAMAFYNALMACPAVTCPEPRVSPGPDGSVDLKWSTLRAVRQLLINVPDGSGDVEYYGADEGGRGTTVKGVIDDAMPNLWLVYWLVGV